MSILHSSNQAGMPTAASNRESVELQAGFSHCGALLIQEIEDVKIYFSFLQIFF